MRYDNRGLFSNHFLATRLTDMPQWQGFVVDQQQRTRMLEVLEQAQVGLPAANEAQTEQDLIRPLLDILGLDYDVQTGLSGVGRAQHSRLRDLSDYGGPGGRATASRHGRLLARRFRSRRREGLVGRPRPDRRRRSRPYPHSRSPSTSAILSVPGVC